MEQKDKIVAAIKLTKRQREIVWKMQNGWVLITGMSDTDNKCYQMVTTGYENDYLNVTVFGELLKKKIISQQNSRPFDWELTKLGESIVFKSAPKNSKQ